MQSRRPQLTLDSSLFEEDNNEQDELLTTFRQDGVTIGPDYLRLDGATITRGQLLPDCLTRHEQIGKGAFSTVYKATWANKRQKQQSNDDGAQPQHTVDREITVAVKIFTMDSSSRNDMLVKELKSLVSIQQTLQNVSKSLIQLHGAFLQQDQVAMVLEYMNTGSLDDFLRTRDSRLPSNLLASIAFQVLDGLSALHKFKILHRDLKPANILLDSVRGAVKLADFGLASDASSSSLNMAVLGTSKFMAPERLRGRAYGRTSDLWSFGLCLIQCLTLEPPWKDCQSLVELLVTVEETQPQDVVPEHTEARLAEILVACLQQDPGTCRC
jgi:serine/threonine protein kinase